jgi:hypothetical protein
VSTLSEVYHRLCTEERFPSKDVTDCQKRQQRQSNLKTSLRYLAAAHDSTPETLFLTPEVEATYKDQIRSYLTAQGKGLSTIRNSIQDVGQFLRAYHQLPLKTPVLQAKDRPKLRRGETGKVAKGSPYQHWAWLIQSPYYLPIDQWPQEIRTPFEKYRQLRKDQIRTGTLAMQAKAIEAYLGYLRMSGEERLTYLAPESRAKLEMKRYREDLETILSAPQTLTWNDLFVVDHLKSFVVWQSWRIHTPEDALVVERPPSKLSAKAKVVGETVLRLAQHLQRKRDIQPIATYLRHLPEPRKIHNKRADYHQFSCDELEQVALTLMEEARSMVIVPVTWTGYKHPGASPASRFATGLILMMGWRIPIRIRNWSEALIGTNLLKINGDWYWHFEGAELKVGERNGETNIFEVKIPAQVVPYLEEYLNVWRPKLPRADTDRHLLLNMREPGGWLPRQALHMKLRLHVFRLTGKRFFPHLLRTLFVSHAINHGMDLNSVAFYMNDKPETVLQAYNELNAQQHQHAADDFYDRVLKNGNGNGNGNGKTP